MKGAKNYNLLSLEPENAFNFKDDTYFEQT